MRTATSQHYPTNHQWSGTELNRHERTGAGMREFVRPITRLQIEG